jgi:hypothetical protein
MGALGSPTDSASFRVEGRLLLGMARVVEWFGEGSAFDSK